MNVKQVRALNLALLVRYKCGDSQRLFAETYDLSASHVSQIIQGHRDMGDKYARKVEDLLALDPGAMDSPLPLEDISNGVKDTHAARLAALQAYWPQLTDADTENLLNTAKLFAEARALQKKQRKPKRSTVT